MESGQFGNEINSTKGYAVNNWLFYSFVVLALWGTYGIFGNEATKIHGEKVSMAFEAGGMALIALFAFALSSGSIGEFSKATGRSIVYASIMGLMSAGGLFLQLYALRLAPKEVGLILFITGMWPVISVITAYFLGSRYTGRQWCGITLAIVGLVLVGLPAKKEKPAEKHTQVPLPPDPHDFRP